MFYLNPMYTSERPRYFRLNGDNLESFNHRFLILSDPREVLRLSLALRRAGGGGLVRHRQVRGARHALRRPHHEQGPRIHQVNHCAGN